MLRFCLFVFFCLSNNSELKKYNMMIISTYILVHIHVISKYDDFAEWKRNNKVGRWFCGDGARMGNGVGCV